MKVTRCTVSVSVAILFWSACGQILLGGEAERSAAEFDKHVRPFLTMYCAGCHGGDEPEGGLGLDAFESVPNVVDELERWTGIVEMVRTQEMPPEDEPQPDDDERERFLAWVEVELAKFDCSSQPPQPGRVTVRRLNRTEYNNTVRDFLGIDFKPAADFPADDVGEGFDNIADVLSLPPLLMEKYLDAAETISAEVMQDDKLRGRIIPCRPTEDKSRDACTQEAIQSLGKLAFRRPLDADQHQRLLKLAQAMEQRGASYEQGIELILQALLISPEFLFRIEFDDEADTQIRPLNDYELATRLSYFLWSSMPDAELFDLADEGRLQDPAVLAAQARRMLNDEKAVALVDSFADQWLQLRLLEKAAPDPQRYPAFDESLRQAMAQETKLFFQSIIRDDRSILDLIDADYTFVNRRLARHYGLEDVPNEEFREVRLPDGRRGGILTQASILTLTSNPTRTSPVKRGKWILDNILGTPPPPPPPNVPELEDGDVELLGSFRERMQQHRENPSCAVCHRKMDPLGLGFENFDGIGAWRERDGRFEIDASAELPGGVRFEGPQELRTILMASSEEFTRCLARKMLIYALGRGLESTDLCTVKDIVSQVQQNEHRFSSLVVAIVTSDPFRLRGLLIE